MSSTSSTTDSYFDKRTLCPVKMGPGTVSRFGRDTRQVSFLCTAGSVHIGVVSVALDKRERMGCNASGRTVSHSVIMGSRFGGQRDATP